MSDQVKAAIIGGVFVVVAAAVSLLPRLFGDDAVTVAAKDGGKIVLREQLPPEQAPSSAVADVLNNISPEDARRIVEFGLIGRNNVGLIHQCLHDQTDEEELAAYQRLAELGLGSVDISEAEPAPLPTVYSEGPDENGQYPAFISQGMLERMCERSNMCPRSFSFVPSDLGIEVRTFLRNLLASQIARPEGDSSTG